MRQLLLAAAAIERGDPIAANIMGGALEDARRGGFLNTVVTTAPQVTSYLAGHPGQLRQDPFTEQVIGCGSRRTRRSPMSPGLVAGSLSR